MITEFMDAISRENGVLGSMDEENIQRLDPVATARIIALSHPEHVLSIAQCVVNIAHVVRDADRVLDGQPNDLTEHDYGYIGSDSEVDEDDSDDDDDMSVDADPFIIMDWDQAVGLDDVYGDGPVEEGPPDDDD